jgi:hypothetical protein
MIITVKANTAAAKCDINGVFSSNIRPNIYAMNKESKVVKSGFNGKYTWYIVEYYSGYSFITNLDVAK